MLHLPTPASYSELISSYVIYLISTVLLRCVYTYSYLYRKLEQHMRFSTTPTGYEAGFSQPQSCRYISTGHYLENVNRCIVVIT